jgi:hypothetical protein
MKPRTLGHWNAEYDIWTIYCVVCHRAGPQKTWHFVGFYVNPLLGPGGTPMGQLIYGASGVPLFALTDGQVTVTGPPISQCA